MAETKKVRKAVSGLNPDLHANLAGDGPPDDAMLRRAAEAIAELGETFEKHAIAEVERMYRFFREGSDVEAKRQGNAQAILEFADELRDQGSKFEYPLVTRISGSLCKFIESRARTGALDEEDFEVICVHLDALNAVLALRVIGDGGPTGKEIGDGLKTAVRNILA